MIKGVKGVASLTADSRPHQRRHSHLVGIHDSLVFSPDGKSLAAGSRSSGVNIWDLASRPPQKASSVLPGECHRVSLDPCGNFLATGFSRNTVSVWGLGETPEALLTFTPFETEERVVSAAAYAPTADLVACGDSQGTLYLWDGQQSQERYTIKAYTGWVRSVLLSPDAKYLASIAEPRRAFQLWEVESGEALGEFPNGIEAVAFSPNGDLVACGLPKEILVWDIIRGEARFTLPHTQQSWFPAAVTFSPCGRYLVSGAMWHRGRGIKKVTIRLWDLHDGGKTIATFRGHPDSVKSLTFSPDGSLLASGSSDGTILLWDLQSVKEG